MNGYFVSMETPSDPGAGNTPLLAAGCKNISGPASDSEIRLTFHWLSERNRLLHSDKVEIPGVIPVLLVFSLFFFSA